MNNILIFPNSQNCKELTLDKEIICGIIECKFYFAKKYPVVGFAKRKVLFTMMKKAILSVISFTALAAMLTACSNRTGSDTDTSVDTSIDTDSSYYGVNYSGLHLGNSSVSVGHSSLVPSSRSSEESTASSSSSAVSSLKPSSTAQSSNTGSSSSGTQAKTLITYYYFDETGEHTTDTEVYIDTDTSEESSSAPAPSSSEIPSSSENETDTSTDTEETVSTDVGDFTEEDLVFVYNGTSITFDMNIEDIAASIGEPLNIEVIHDPESTERELRIYNYEHFSIETAPSDDATVFWVTGLQIFDDSVYTIKDVHIGMTTDEATAVYGKDVMIYGNEYRYYIGNRYMYLYIMNDIVANIGYGYDNDISPAGE